MPTKTLSLDAAKIDRLRIQKGWALDTLARKAIVSNRTVDSVMAGKGVMVSTAKKLANALEVGMDDIMPTAAKDLAPITSTVPFEPSDPGIAVTFRLGMRQKNGRLVPTLFADFDEVDTAIHVLDGIRQLLCLQDIALPDAEVHRDSGTAKRGGNHIDGTTTGEGGAMMTIVIANSEFNQIAEMEMSRNPAYIDLGIEIDYRVTASNRI